MDNVTQTAVNQDTQTGQSDFVDVPNIGDLDSFGNYLDDPMASDDGSALGNPAPSQASDDNVDNWEIRARYFQSERDKALNEINQLRQELEQLKSGLYANPQASNVYAGSEPDVQEPVLEKPVKPEKPANFSEQEAISDPTSESARYLEDLARYQEELAEYIEKKESLREQQELRERQLREQMAAQQQFIAETYREVQAKFGMSPQEALDFIQFANSPESVRLDHLVGYYKYVKSRMGKQGAPPAPQTKQPNTTPPVPGVAGGGQPNAPVGTADSFLNDLQKGGRNLFETY